MKSFLAELRRRNVVRVAAAYVVAAWLIVQVVETIFPAFGFGDDATRVVVIVLAIGLLPVIVAAWVFELTPDGLKLDNDAEPGEPVSPRTGKTLDRFIMVTLALALGYFALDKFVLSESRETAIAERAREAGRTEAIVEAYGEKSIAVLPFADLSPGGDQAYFADGISEEVLNLLAGVDALRVISRSSSFALRDAGLSTPEAARRLAVRYVLAGSVRRAGDQVRITAQLIDGPSDTQLWSETYDRMIADVFAVQDEIARQVVDALKIRLLGASPTAGPTSSAAYDIYLQGLDAFARREEIPGAIELFEQVIAIDPHWAPAYASLALALIFSDQDASIRNPRIEAAVNRALDFGSGNPDALAALGRLRLEQSRIDEGRSHLEQAIAGNPSHALAIRWLGTSYREADPTRYYRLSRQAFAINPLDPTIKIHMAVASSMLGKYDEALDAASGLPSPTRYMMAGNIHHQFGDLATSLKSFYVAYRDAGQFGALPRELMMMAEYDLVEVWLREGSGITHHALANLAAIRGDKQQAFRILQDSEPENDWHLATAHVRFTGDFVAARNHLERFFADSGVQEQHFDPAHWHPFVVYAKTLLETGDRERATELIDEISDFIETRIAAGVVRDAYDLNFQFWLSALHAMRDDPEQSIAALRSAAPQGGLTCTFCVRIWSYWDGVRDEPGFIRLLESAEATKEEQRRRLADEGMLLTPEAVRQLPEFEFDPFADLAQ